MFKKIFFLCFVVTMLGCQSQRQVTKTPSKDNKVEDEIARNELAIKDYNFVEATAELIEILNQVGAINPERSKNQNGYLKMYAAPDMHCDSTIYQARIEGDDLYLTQLTYVRNYDDNVTVSQMIIVDFDIDGNFDILSFAGSSQTWAPFETPDLYSVHRQLYFSHENRFGLDLGCRLNRSRVNAFAMQIIEGVRSWYEGTN